MFNKSLIATLAAVTSFAGIAKADKLDSVSVNGTFSSDNTQFVSVYVNATAYLFSDPAQAPQINGTVNISGYSGALAVNFGAPVKSVTFDLVPISGASYPRAHLSTGKFFFYNLATGKKTLATAEVEVIKYGTRGMICFTVTSAADGSTLAMTCDNKGSLIDLPLTSGGTTIKAP